MLLILLILNLFSWAYLTHGMDDEDEFLSYLFLIPCLALGLLFLIVALVLDRLEERS